MNNARFIIIGITDAPNPYFPPEVLEIIRGSRVFSGGKRHHEIVRQLLPEGTEWIDITVPLEKVFEQYKQTLPPPSLSGRDQSPIKKITRGREEKESIIVFASGDPLFFGFANTLKREFPGESMKLYPTFNSLQMLAHRLVLPYHDMRIVSLTGRPWPAFDRALIERAPKIGILTDKEHTPAAIAQRMLEYGYTNYIMHVGEHLGNPELERVTTLSLEEAAEREFAMPNCVIADSPPALPIREGAVTFEKIKSDVCSGQSAPSLTGRLGSLEKPLNVASTPQRGANSPFATEGKAGVESYFGIPDSSFALLDGREKMITKMPIRLLTLQALDLKNRHVLWDIGACTGSVSIEARLLFPHLHIEAFEIRPECEAIIQENMRRHGAMGIEVHIGDFLDSPPALPAICSEQASALISSKVTAPPLRERAGGESPDAVFIGGHGGKLKEIMARVVTVLAPGGVIVMNSVKAPKVLTDSHRLWNEACQELGLIQEPPTRIVLNDNNPIEILKALVPSPAPRSPLKGRRAAEEGEIIVES